MQLDISLGSLVAIKYLETNGVYLFELTQSVLRLMPVSLIHILTLTTINIIITLLVKLLVDDKILHAYVNTCCVLDFTSSAIVIQSTDFYNKTELLISWKRWDQKILRYEFIIMYHPVTIIKGIDNISR